MRTKVTVFTAVLLLASMPAWAQTPPGSTAPPPIVAPSFGTIDFGGRFTTTTGDAARYERYRDLRDGVYTRLTFDKQTDKSITSADIFNVGYRDQSYRGSYADGKMKAYGLWDSIPLNYSYITSTPWVTTTTGSTANFALDLAARQAVQAKVPGVVGIPQNAAQLATPSIFRDLAKPFDMQQRRDTAGVGLAYDIGHDVNLNVVYTSTAKTGTMPWAASFAFNNANELALPLDNRSNDVSVGAEWAGKNGMVRVGWDGSWFNNNLHDIVWDNPIRATDFNNGLLPPLGPYDPSGYSNGNGPAQGRMALAPDNSMNVLSAMGLYKMPAHSSLNATVSLTDMRQNDTLIPWTINPVVANPVVYAAFPALTNLPRNSAEAAMRGINALFNFNTSPSKYFTFTMKYRFNSHDNQTPAFDAVEYVRFDAVPEETGTETEQFDIKRRTLDVNASFHVAPYTALRVGYGYDAFNRSGRSFSDMADDIVRMSIDTTRYQYVTLRATFEHIVRTGSGFSEDALEEGGSQPGLRFYDESDRTRNRGTFLVTIMPVSFLDITMSYAQGEDTYTGEGHEFGLLNTDNTAYNVGVSLSANQHFALGANYGRDTYKANQSSRNANPSCTLSVPPCAPGTYDSWTDPNRTWFLDNNEEVNTANVYIDLIRVLKNTDIRFMYDFSDSDNSFMHSGPRIVELSTNTALTPGDTKPCAAGLTSCFIALPNVTNQWQRVSADIKFYFTPKVGVGFAWYYEKLDVTDYATIDLPGQPGVPRIDYLGELSTGYGVRPYTGNTGTIRLLYKF